MFQTRLLCSVLAGVLLSLPVLADRGTSQLTLGANPDLVDGADALREGEYAEGVELTRRGLPFAQTRDNRFAAFNNMCAGLAALKQYDEAMSFCARALAIDSNNRHIIQNHAYTLLGMGRIEEAIAEAQRGLTIAPKADRLLLVLSLAEDAQREKTQNPHVIMEDFP